MNYEAQAAIEFESALDPDEHGEYPFEIRDGVIYPTECIQSIVADIHKGISLPVISARFHNGVAELTRNVCKEIRNQTGINEIALSGGIWQNMALLSESLRRLERDGYIIYRHHQVPTNDGGLSLGQALVAAAQLS